MSNQMAEALSILEDCHRMSCEAQQKEISLLRAEEEATRPATLRQTPSAAASRLEHRHFLERDH